MQSCNSHFLHWRKTDKAYRAKILNKDKTKYSVCLMYNSCITCRNCPKKLAELQEIMERNSDLMTPQPPFYSPELKQQRKWRTKFRSAISTSCFVNICTSCLLIPQILVPIAIDFNSKTSYLEAEPIQTHTKYSPYQAEATGNVFVRLGKAAKLLWNIRKTCCSSFLMANKPPVFWLPPHNFSFFLI